MVAAKSKLSIRLTARQGRLRALAEAGVSEAMRLVSANRSSGEMG